MALRINLEYCPGTCGDQPLEVCSGNTRSFSRVGANLEIGLEVIQQPAAFSFALKLQQ
jgi:hypothetical protein